MPSTFLLLDMYVIMVWSSVPVSTFRATWFQSLVFSNRFTPIRVMVDFTQGALAMPWEYTLNEITGSCRAPCTHTHTVMPRHCLV